MQPFVTKKTFAEYIKNFKFFELFNELGWDAFKETKKIKLGDDEYTLNGIAEKKGFAVFECVPENLDSMPIKSERKKIEKEIAKIYHEHLLIFTDKQKKEQVWQLALREPNKPIQYREFKYYSNQEPELLFQKLRNLFFSLDEEENITILDVVQRVTEQFGQNAEKVTKKFYAEFKKRHDAFQSFIEGLENKTDIDWYTSLMLNRLMFIYFIQKKGFLDGDTNYLSNKLKTVKEKQGANRFYKSFYKTFLLTLFHKGLGKPEHTPELEEEIGKVPYLNGGLFDVHELEKENDRLDIKDEAFEKLFAFFDEYNWHLDTRPDASGKDINPDVIGYIFEKYINYRAEMGAYYTKEDITEYISKNTIIPFLFDRVKEKVKHAFEPGSSLWNLLKENPDRYIYDAVKKGVPEKGGLFDDLPDEIKAGFRPDLEKETVKETTSPHLWEIRKVWNKKAPENIALPTETYRELIERRKRYAEIKTKMLNGEINDINDFITYNLDIRQFAQDAVEQYEGSDFISAFYDALKNITILDPTAGSGAFLFAALNILEPLYEACIDRMREFIDVDDKTGSGKKYAKFREILAEIEKHPSEKYYIYKSIILNNLYGVDIMKEAVEIAKLRLFLKLVAVVDPDPEKENYGLEPLPDIDFNIRAGNTLVGYATESELDKGLNWSFDFDNDKEKLHEKMDVVARAFKRYKEIQLSNDDFDFAGFKKAKDDLRKRLKELNEALNDYLAKDYGIFKDKEPEKYKGWLASHKPFHWFAEYYEIIHERGGFDVIIGNPPYVEYNTVNYELKNYKTLTCGNLYAYSVERSTLLLTLNAKFGMIIPTSVTSTDGYIPLQKILLSQGNLFISSYSDQRGKLFDIPHPRLSIVIYGKTVDKLIYVTQYNKLGGAFLREKLFQRIIYKKVNDIYELGRFPRIGNKIEFDIFKKIKAKPKAGNYFVKKGNNKIYFTRKISWFLQILDFIPEIYDENGKLRLPSELKTIVIQDEKKSKIYFSALNSTLFYWFVTVGSDCRNLNMREIKDFRIDLNEIVLNKLKNISKYLSNQLKENSKFCKMRFPSIGVLLIQCIFPNKCKPIIDQIDTILAEHYGFTEEELDFIINYDIKYRMGKELDAYIEGRLGE